MTNQLLEVAKKFQGKRKSQGRVVVTKDECEMMVEFLKGNITAIQYGHAINKKQTVIHQRIFSVMRQGLANGWIEIKTL